MFLSCDDARTQFAGLNRTAAVQLALSMIETGEEQMANELLSRADSELRIALEIAFKMVSLYSDWQLPKVEPKPPGALAGRTRGKSDG